MKRLIISTLILTAFILSASAQKKEESSQTNEKKKEIFVVVEEMPTFRGGDVYKFRDWVQERVVYPKELVKDKIEGKVFIMFVVEEDGSVSSAQIMRGLHPLLDKEVIRVVESSPKWKPGLQQEKPVNVRFSITTEFKLI